MPRDQLVIRCKLHLLMGAHRHKIQHVADETGISRSTLTRLYYNKEDVRSVTYEVLAKLCALYDCQPGDILEAVPISVAQQENE